MATEPLAAPVAPEDRVEALDVRRGFALLGTLLANMRWYSFPLDAAPTLADAAARCWAWPTSPASPCCGAGRAGRGLTEGGGVMLNLFGDRPAGDPAARERVKGWARELLSLDESATILVTELTCTEEGCPDIETVVAVLDQPGRPRKYKVGKPTAEVTRDDLLVAITRAAEAP